MKKLTFLRIAAALLLGAASVAAFAVQRTFVASYGLDTNPCSVTSPCRSFAAAMTPTDVNGEIIVLDSAGYGAFTIDKSVSIIAPDGVYAGISVFSTQDGITVNPGPTGKVVLRGLLINGQGGNRGIVVQSGEEVHIERTVIANLLGAGIRVSGGSAIYVTGTTIRSNGGLGIDMALGTPNVNVADTRIVDNAGNGIQALGLASLTLNRVQADNNLFSGVLVSPSGAGTVTVLARDCHFTGNGDQGFSADANGSGKVLKVTVENSSAQRNGGIGISIGADGGASATGIVSRSAANGNTGIGMQVFAAGVGTTTRVTIEGSSAVGNVQSGFITGTDGSGVATAFITGSHSSGNGSVGITASGPTATVYVRGSTITRNPVGMSVLSGATLSSCQDNLRVLNDTDLAGTPPSLVTCNQ